MTEIPNPTPVSCDSTDVEFSLTIVPILQQSCYNGCHDGSAPSSNIPLDSYEAVKITVDNERLFGAIARQPGFSAMPLGGNSISDCELAKFKGWIDEGAMDN